MAESKNLQLVLVTPEKILLDEPVESLRFPLFDGQIGILPARAPMVGRLGYGELKMRSNSGEKTFFVDGGFVQMKGSVVSLLTNRALTTDEINRKEAEEQLSESIARKAITDIEVANKSRDQQRARQLLAMAK